MSKIHRLTPPLTRADLEPLKSGDPVLITGHIFSARDSVHKRLVEDINRRRPLPIDVSGQIIYYLGPTPPPPGRPIGAAGPTSSYRMDPYTPPLLELGLKATIGKGIRTEEVKAAMLKYGAVYLAAIGGAGALLSRTIKAVEIVGYEDLGQAAIRRLTVEDFPTTVINDLYGGDLFQEARQRWAQPQD
jgi:fumarate hydratase subunit beta